MFIVAFCNSMHCLTAIRSLFHFVLHSLHSLSMPHSIIFNIAHTHKMSIRFHYAFSHNNLTPYTGFGLRQIYSGFFFHWKITNATISSSGFAGLWAHQQKHQQILWTFHFVITFHYSFLARSVLFRRTFKTFLSVVTCVCAEQIQLIRR